MNNLDQLEKKHKELGEEIARLKNPDLPQKGKYYLRGDSEVEMDSSDDASFCFAYNQFNNKKTAQIAALENKIQRALIQCRETYCPDFIEDWGDDEYKYYPTFAGGKIEFSVNYETHILSAIYFDTSGSATKAGNHVLPMFKELQELRK